MIVVDSVGCLVLAREIILQRTRKDLDWLVFLKERATKWVPLTSAQKYPSSEDCRSFFTCSSRGYLMVLGRYILSLT